MSKANMDNISCSISSSESEDSENFGDTSLFQEPDGYFRPEEPPSFAEHTLLSGQRLQMRLVGHNPLWVRPLVRLHIDQQLMLPIGPPPVEWRPGRI